MGVGAGLKCRGECCVVGGLVSARCKLKGGPGVRDRIQNVGRKVVGKWPCWRLGASGRVAWC